MKKLTFLLIGLLVINLSFSQLKALKITKPGSKKEIIIKENKRVKIRTASGQKISGRVTIQDENTILINNMPFALSDIEAIKRQPLLLSIFGRGLLIYGGGILTGMGAIIGLLIESSGYYLMIPGAAMIATGIVGPNVNRNFKKAKNWQFEVISLNE